MKLIGDEEEREMVLATRQRRGTMKKANTIVGFTVAVVLVLGLVAGCGSSAGGSGATVTGSEAASSGATSDENSANGGESSTAAAGTLENPLPLGTTARVGDWEITVTDVNLNANDAVAKANEFNDSPAEGTQFVLATVKAKYVGEESGTFWVDIAYKFYGSGGNTFDSGEAVAVPPHPITDAGETFPGAEITGELLFQVASDQVDGGAIIMEDWASLDDTRVFFAIK